MNIYDWLQAAHDHKT